MKMSFSCSSSRRTTSPASTTTATAGAPGAASPAAVNAVVRTLQEEGLITTRRGRIQVVDRAGLKTRACECHDAVERHFAAVIGSGGSGS